MSFYSNHLEVLADYALLNNNKKQAIKYYIKSIALNPLVIKKFLKIIITIIGGPKLYNYLLKGRNNINKFLFH